MREAICYLFGAGEYGGALPTPAPGDFVIAVDGGAAVAAAAGIPIDLLVGDLDSLELPPEHFSCAQLLLPREKDDTDMHAALREGLARGYRLFHLYGGTGGRLDHTLANIQCLFWLCRAAARGLLFDRDTVLTVLQDGVLHFPAAAQGILSVFALSNVAQGVCARGLKYGLEDATLYNDCPVGISNEFIGKAAELSVERGALLLIYPRDVSAETVEHAR